MNVKEQAGGCLAGRTALVTGAGKGLGRAIALGLASAGADVVLMARTRADLDAVARDVEAFGRQALVGSPRFQCNK